MGETKPCPKCGVPHPTAPGAVDWCEACGWNVQPAVVYAALLGMLAAGIWLLATQRRNPFADLVVAALVGAVLVARPRVHPEPETIIDPLAAPELYAVVHRVSAALGARPVDGISLNTSFNASFGRSGWRGRRYLTIGLPLWSVLDREERVALLGHEIGHDVNGDPARSAVVQSALMSLIELHALFAPQSYVLAPSALSPTIGVAAMVANGIMRIASQVFRPPVALFRMIVWRESQRAEFEADRLAARVAGPHAAMGLLEKLQLGDTVRKIVGAAAVQGPGCNVLDRIRDRVRAMPARERARLRAAMQLEDARFDATHPPTRHRVELLRGFPATNPAVTMSDVEHAAVEAELARFERAASSHLIDQARDRLSRRY